MVNNTCVIHPSFKCGENFKIGQFSVIEEAVIVGGDVSIGHHSVIGKDVIIGSNVKIGNFCYLKSGTRFANNIDFADYCKTTGICYVGNNVNIRTGSCISKSVIVEDKAFIGAGIMSSHTKHIYHQRPKIPKRQLITRIGYGAVIGSHTNLSAGVRIGDNVVIGYGSIVTKDFLELGIYVGNPLRKLANVPPEIIIPKPKEYKEHQFPKEMLAKYLPYYKEE
jgi:acetyltransferase-like isoleucine patch superfamily enzyme